MSTITTPPELAEPAPIWKSVILEAEPSQVGACAPASATVKLSRLAAITADDHVVVSVDDHILPWHTRVSASPPSATTERLALVPLDLSVTALPSGREVRITCRSAFGGAVVSFDGRVAACRLCEVALHRDSPYDVINNL